jgi:hypothetical protein
MLSTSFNRRMVYASDDFYGDEVGFGFASQSLLAFGNLRVLHLRRGLIRFVDRKSIED